MTLTRGYVDGLPFLKVLGKTPQVGVGTLYTYTVYVEQGIEIDQVQFGLTIDAILGNATKGWIKSGVVAFQRVNRYANTKLVLATPDTVDKLCYPLRTEGEVSCCQGNKVVVNVTRWMEAVPHWTGTLKTYRRMLVNHEFGHRIGQNHRFCPGAGQLAPVMQQQTYGLQGCVHNSWPLDSEIASLRVPRTTGTQQKKSQSAL